MAHGVHAVIETARLRLRRFRDDDRDTVARWNADPEFTRHLAGPQTRAQSDEAFDRWARHWDEHGFGLLAVEWRETGALIGRCGPQFHRMWPDDPEVGWALDPAWWGRGHPLGVRRTRLPARRLYHHRAQRRLAQRDGEARVPALRAGAERVGSSLGPCPRSVAWAAA
jgi:hypothetical protein